MPVVLNIIEEESRVVIESASTPGPPGADGANGIGVPAGGIAGQVLGKTTDTDYDTEWFDQTGGGGGGGGAPTNATYLVASASGTLTAEVVVGATPGGDLGGTWAAPTVDATHSGSSHAGVQAAAAIDATTKANAAQAAAIAASQPLDADLTTIAAASNSAVLAATTASFTTADETKLDGIETSADANPVEATQAEMEAGTEASLRSMSPLRVAQAIVELAGGGPEQIEDLVGLMVTGNTETGIALTYDDTTGKINAVVAQTAADISFTPTGTIVATDVQAAITEAATEAGTDEVFAEDPTDPGTYVQAPLYIGETDPAVGGEEPYVWLNPAEIGSPSDYVTQTEFDTLPELVAADPFEQEYTTAGGTTTSTLTGDFDAGSGAHVHLRDEQVGLYLAPGNTTASVALAHFGGTPMIYFSNGTGGAVTTLVANGTTLTSSVGITLTSSPAAGTNDTKVATTAFVQRFATVRHGKLVGDYYQDAGTSGTSASAPALNRMYLWNKVLPAGTLDRVGIEVTTLEASSVSRLGIYLTDAATGLPTTLIAEATGTTDNSTTGNKELTISAVLPKYDVYCWAFVVQGASSAVRFRTVNSGSGIPIPLGTSAPSTGANQSTIRHISSTSGALPAGPLGALSSTETNNPPRFFYRFSA